MCVKEKTTTEDDERVEEIRERYHEECVAETKGNSVGWEGEFTEKDSSTEGCKGGKENTGEKRMLAGGGKSDEIERKK